MIPDGTTTTIHRIAAIIYEGSTSTSLYATNEKRTEQEQDA